MPDLIAQGNESHQRWRRPLREGERIVLGRAAGTWSVDWDGQISRQHVELLWEEGRLEVRRLPTGRNPVFVAGHDSGRFYLQPGEHFVIGQTTFTLADEQLDISLDAPAPIEEQTFSAQYLQQLRFRNADHRIEVLSRLPEVISGAVNDEELFVRLVNLLLAGIPRAAAVALVALEQGPDSTERVGTLHWDRRRQTGGHFQPSQRLIVEAVTRGQSVLHVWNASSAQSAAFTVSEDIDWAFCTPVPGRSCAGWGIYVAGRFAARQNRTDAAEPSDPADLREDLKFTELLSSFLSSLRQMQALQRQHATLSHFFAPAVLAAMSEADPLAVLEPRETEVTVLFCDLRGFSLRAERNANQLLALLKRVSEALGVMTHHIFQGGGVLGDFQGDAAMGFWGWPIPQPDAIQRACQAALAIRLAFEEAARDPKHPLADFRVGIGVATGRAVAGQIGTVDQVKVTVFGPVVNLASRLEGMTKQIRAPILVDEATAHAVRHTVSREVVRCRRVARVKPYGMDRAVEISELLPPAGRWPQLTDEHLQAYEEALDQFLVGNWSEAMELLQQVPARDRVKDFLTIFIAQYNRTPPTNWDGVIPLTSK
jgi:adenylate cyclase